MIIRETTGYKNSYKKIKRNPDLKFQLSKVISHIEAVKNFDELQNHPISYIYDFEVLRGDLSGFYKFTINQKNNKLRLLFSCENNVIILEFISDEHYMDFKRYLRKL